MILHKIIKLNPNPTDCNIDVPSTIYNINLPISLLEHKTLSHFMRTYTHTRARLSPREMNRDAAFTTHRYDFYYGPAAIVSKGDGHLSIVKSLRLICSVRDATMQICNGRRVQRCAFQAAIATVAQAANFVRIDSR